MHLVIGYFKVATHLCISRGNCIHVETAAEEVVYEVVAEPPEPLEQAQQEERRENPAKGPVHPSTQQQPEGKPRCIYYYLKLCHLYMSLIIMHYV